MTRQNDVLEARAAADEWAATKGLQPSGGYSGDWYRDGYLGGWWPNGWVRWWAMYGVTPTVGGDMVAHQYASSPIDSDVMMESEIQRVDDPERKAYEDKIASLVNTLGYICGDLLKPLTRPTAANYVKTFVTAARAEADKQNINHA